VVSCLSTCIFPDKTTYPIDETMVRSKVIHCTFACYFSCINKLIYGNVEFLISNFNILLNDLKTLRYSPYYIVQIIQYNNIKCIIFYV